MSLKYFFCRTLPMRRAVRILGRKYPLTATGYKFLEIGINVGPPSYVEIAIGDHRGNELILSLETWKGLYEQRWNIQEYLWNRCKDIQHSISVGPLLTVRFCTFNDTTLVRLESSKVCLTMTESTLITMFNLDQCIDLTFNQLDHILKKVDAKFVQFSNIASTVMNKQNTSNVIRVSDAFNKHQLVDCELLALFFN